MACFNGKIIVRVYIFKTWMKVPGFRVLTLDIFICVHVTAIHSSKNALVQPHHRVIRSHHQVYCKAWKHTQIPPRACWTSGEQPTMFTWLPEWNEEHTRHALSSFSVRWSHYHKTKPEQSQVISRWRKHGFAMVLAVSLWQIILTVVITLHDITHLRAQMRAHIISWQANPLSKQWLI